MKLSDDAHDKKGNIFLGIFAGVLCGLFISYLVINSADATYIFLGILIGTLVAKKIDCINHFVTLLVFLGIIIIFGLPSISIFTLIICTMAAYIDEIGNDNKWVSKKNEKLELFFKYRFALKLVILVLASFGTLQIFYPSFKIAGIQFLHFSTFIYFLAFEISYEVAGLKFDAIYNGFYSFFRVFRGIYRSSNN
ncbi:MAG: hypothetical protein FJ150_03500 [Euryarchaeota archaeon]|nr:hypothetical protein [Euryarchaeota archaeon]